MVEGPWDKGPGTEVVLTVVMDVVGKSHEVVHAMGCPRVATDVRVGTRVDKLAHMEDKVSSVREALAKEGLTLNEG
jgi:uncharacterized protein YqgV (UPF0045/DUF77 family)